MEFYYLISNTNRELVITWGLLPGASCWSLVFSADEFENIKIDLLTNKIIVS